VKLSHTVHREEQVIAQVLGLAHPHWRFTHCIEVVGVGIATREQMAPLIDWCTEHLGIEFGEENRQGVWYLAGWGSCFFFDHESAALMFYIKFSGGDPNA
jgi:hypothetical protein